MWPSPEVPGQVEDRPAAVPRGVHVPTSAGSGIRVPWVVCSVRERDLGAGPDTDRRPAGGWGGAVGVPVRQPQAEPHEGDRDDGRDRGLYLRAVSEQVAKLRCARAEFGERVVASAAWWFPVRTYAKRESCPPYAPMNPRNPS